MNVFHLEPKIEPETQPVNSSLPQKNGQILISGFPNTKFHSIGCCGPPGCCCCCTII